MRYVLAVLLAAAACAGEAPAPPAATSAPPATPSPASTGLPTALPTNASLYEVAQVVGRTLREAAIAEEVYYVDYQKGYTRNGRILAENGFKAPRGVTVVVVSASADAYCLKGTGGGLTLYYDSDVGRVSETPCS